MEQLLNYLEWMQLKTFLSKKKAKSRRQKAKLNGEIKAYQVAIDYIENYLEGGLG